MSFHSLVIKLRNEIFGYGDYDNKPQETKKSTKPKLIQPIFRKLIHYFNDEPICSRK
jgi:hypothetical protein